MELEIDYAFSGKNIQYAMLDLHRRYPDKQVRPNHIIWNGLRVKTYDTVLIPKQGIIRGEFLSAKSDVPQGFDFEIKGGIELSDGTRVPLLRTWYEPIYEDVVEYPFYSKDGLLKVWNVYKKQYPNNELVTEKMTGNAGFWVEQVSDSERIYHCSHGLLSAPDFDCFVFKVSILVAA